MIKCEGCVNFYIKNQCEECFQWDKFEGINCYDVLCNSNCSEYLSCERSVYVTRLKRQQDNYRAIQWDNHGCLAMDDDDIDCEGHCNECIYLCEIDDNGAVVLTPEEDEDDEYCAPEGWGGIRITARRSSILAKRNKGEVMERKYEIMIENAYDDGYEDAMQENEDRVGIHEEWAFKDGYNSGFEDGMLKGYEKAKKLFNAYKEAI